MAKPILQSWLPPPGPFSTFNREERNAVAILYTALLQDDNLSRFADTVGWADLGDPSSAEVFVEWTYARDLWNQHPDPEKRREAILGLLQPSQADWLRSCSVEELNTYFGATPRPSARDIQYPGRWSLPRFAKNVSDAEEFRRTCVFKWAFNIKPDLVIHGQEPALLCVEAKWNSAEGSYPSSQKEKVEFAQRGLDPVSQTEVQRFLVEDVLGFQGTFCYLVRAGAAASKSHATLTWQEAFSTLEMERLPAFARRWVDRLGSQ